MSFCFTLTRHLPSGWLKDENSDALLRTQQEDITQKPGGWRHRLDIHSGDRMERQNTPTSDPTGGDGTEEAKADLSQVRGVWAPIPTPVLQPSASEGHQGKDGLSKEDEKGAGRAEASGPLAL